MRPPEAVCVSLRVADQQWSSDTILGTNADRGAPPGSSVASGGTTGRRSNVFSTTMFACVLAMAAQGQQPPGGMEAVEPSSHVYDVLRAADEATRRMRSVRYDAVLEGTGARAIRVPVTTGSVTLVRTDERIPDVRVEGVQYAVRELQGEETAFLGVIKEGIARRIDHERRILIRGGSGLRSLDAGFNLIPREFNHPAPFEDEMNAGNATLEGRAFVHDALCDVVLVQYDFGARARWYFGAEDHLLRRVERIRPVDEEYGAIVLTLMNVETDIEVSPETFEVAVPDGYQVKMAAPGSGVGGLGVRRDPDRNR